MRLLPASIGALLLPVSLGAQVLIGNTGELFRYADAHAPLARQARIRPQLAQQEVRLQASALYPKVNVFAAGDYYPLIPTQVIPAEVVGGRPGSYLKAQFGLPYVFQAGAELSMPVINLERWTALQRTAAQRRQAEWSSKAALESFHIQLLQAYYQSLVTREVLALNAENDTVAGQLLRIMESRRQAGVLNPADYNRSRNLRLDVQATGVTYERGYRQSVRQLATLLQVAGDSLILTDSLAAFSWPEPEAAGDIRERPAWGEAQEGITVARLALQESKRGGLPRLALNGRYAYNFQSRFEAGSQDVAFNVANIGLRLDVPLFQGHYYRALQDRSALQLQLAQLEAERTAATLQQQDEDWATLYRSARSRQDVLARKVGNASDNLRIARLNLDEGLMEFDEFNNIFMEYNRARMEDLQNRADGILYYLLSTQKL